MNSNSAGNVGSLDSNTVASYVSISSPQVFKNKDEKKTFRS